MKVRPDLILLLPAYNEAAALPSLLPEADRIFSRNSIEGHILLVNDGSTDGTADIARKIPTVCSKEVIDVQPNRGLAHALRTGFLRCLESSDPDAIVVVMDADDTHRPEQIPQLVEQIQTGLDVVIASRYRKGSEIHGVSGFRKLLSRIAGILFALVAGVPGVRDYTCGYRAYRLSALQKAQTHFGDKLIEEQGFACMAEVLLKLHQTGAQMGEIPLNLRYDRKSGESKMKISATVRRTLALMLNWRFRSRLDN
jgi:dolichol-phosphate mannosyltransferase